MPLHTPAHRKRNNPKKKPKANSATTKLKPIKAKKILQDGEIRGKALTQKQKGFFGAVVC